MTDADQTVFISYRRSNSSFIARAVFQDLRANGYDVFMDVETIDNGEFDKIILHQIAARAHFLLILAPGSLDRCGEPGDWLRIEIEEALRLKRNIVPLLFTGFTFHEAKPYLTGSLERLSAHNALNVPHDYFEEAMNRLRTRFLKQPVAVPVRPTPAAEAERVQDKIEQAGRSAPTSDELSAEELFRQAYQLPEDRQDDKIALYTEVIAKNPAFTTAYNNRANGYKRQNRLHAALADLNVAIEQAPRFVQARITRSQVYADLNQPELALEDAIEAVRYDPQNYLAFFTVGFTFSRLGNDAQAVKAYDEAIKLKPESAIAYNNRGWSKMKLGDYEGALIDCNVALRIDPENANTYDSRATVYYEMGHYNLAIYDYEVALLLDPNLDHSREFLEKARAARP